MPRAVSLRTMAEHLGQSVQARRADEQLPEALLSLSAGLRAGLGLTRALAVTAADLPSPLGPRLRRCVKQTEFGLSLEEALEALRRSLPGEGVALLVWSLAVHRRTGGDLPALCERLCDLLSERRRLRAKLRATTSQSRLSAGIVCFVPFLLGYSLTQLAPSYLAPLFGTKAGWALLAWAALMNGIGLATIFRLSRLDW